jgi:hypothetical protein
MLQMIFSSPSVRDHRENAKRTAPYFLTGKRAKCRAAFFLQASPMRHVSRTRPRSHAGDPPFRAEEVCLVQAREQRFRQVFGVFREKAHLEEKQNEGP